MMDGIEQGRTQVQWGRIAATALPCLIVSLTLAAMHGAAPEDWASRMTAMWALVAAAASAGLLLLSSLDVAKRVVGGRSARQEAREEGVAKGAAKGAGESAGAATGDSAPGGGRRAGRDLPVMAIPHLGRSARESVIAFAQRHGLRPFEDESGFVVADPEGNYYRAAVSM